MSLILRRSAGQSFIIGEIGEIKVTLLRVVDNVAQIRIKAPKSVRIERLERLQKNQSIEAQIILTDEE